MKSFQERLIAAREAAGLSQSELARRMSVTPQAVQKWDKGETRPRGKRLEKLAFELSTSVGHLLAGEIAGNVEFGPSIKGKLPLISWVQAGEWTEIGEVLEAEHAEDWLHCPVSHSDKAFALRVRGESMYNPGGTQSFKDGETIFVDPAKPAVHGSLVIAKLSGSEEVTFKRLVIDEGRCYLQALNPSWPERMFEVDCDCHIAGVVIGKFVAC